MPLHFKVLKSQICKPFVAAGSCRTGLVCILARWCERCLNQALVLTKFSFVIMHWLVIWTLRTAVIWNGLGWWGSMCQWVDVMLWLYCVFLIGCGCLCTVISEMEVKLYRKYEPRNWPSTTVYIVHSDCTDWNNYTQINSSVVMTVLVHLWELSVYVQCDDFLWQLAALHVSSKRACITHPNSKNNFTWLRHFICQRHDDLQQACGYMTMITWLTDGTRLLVGCNNDNNNTNVYNAHIVEH